MSKEKKSKKKIEVALQHWQFKGVRTRKWGRWVSEIRIPKSRTRIWLGSYDAPEKATSAYDAAAFCLHGNEGPFNYSYGKRPKIGEEERKAMIDEQIKKIAEKLVVEELPAGMDQPEGSVVNVESKTCEMDGETFAFDDLDFDLVETLRNFWDLL